VRTATPFLGGLASGVGICTDDIRHRSTLTGSTDCAASFAANTQNLRSNGGKGTIAQRGAF
jgi:hypothetical protein